MKLILASTAFALALTAAFSPAALAGKGAFDSLDKCIEIRENFSQQRAAAFDGLQKAGTAAETANANPEYRDAWMKFKDQQLRALFDRDLLPALQDANVTDVEPVYLKWRDKQFAQYTPEELKKLQDNNFRAELREYLSSKKKEVTARVDEAHRDVSTACKMDVGSQALRVTVSAILAPIDMVSRNLELAKKETGLLSKPLAATTGISVKAIEENGGVFGGGLSGGKNSVFRKNLGIRF